MRKEIIKTVIEAGFQVFSFDNYDKFTSDYFYIKKNENVITAKVINENQFNIVIFSEKNENIIAMIGDVTLQPELLNEALNIVFDNVRLNEDSPENNVPNELRGTAIKTNDSSEEKLVDIIKSNMDISISLMFNRNVQKDSISRLVRNKKNKIKKKKVISFLEKNLFSSENILVTKDKSTVYFSDPKISFDENGDIYYLGGVNWTVEIDLDSIFNKEKPLIKNINLSSVNNISLDNLFNKDFDIFNEHFDLNNFLSILREEV